jgi:hypothetical protein
MALVFPSNPSVNDTYQVNGRTYVWNGTSWRTVKGGVPDVVPTLSVDNDFSAGGTLHIDSTNNEIGIGTGTPSHQLHLTQDLGVDGNLIVGGTITVPTPVAGTNDTKVATTAFVGDAVSTAVSGLLDGAPAALDTLNELAAALDDDASYAATITTALAGKIDTTATFGGDVSGTYDNIVISDDSHNHIIGNVDGLQTALNAKLDSSSYTAADVLAKLITVDGTGSSLDADTLDGSHASAFAASVHTHSYAATSHTHSYAATSHTHSYVPTSGGSVTGNFTAQGNLYVGKNGGGDSYIYFYDDNSNAWREFFWDDSENRFRTSHNMKLSGYLHAGTEMYVGDNGGGDSWIHFYDDNSNTWRTFGWDDSDNEFYTEGGLRLSSGTGVLEGSVNSGGYISTSLRHETSDGYVVYGGIAQSSINNTYAEHSSIQFATDTYWGGVHTLHTGFMITCGGMNGWNTAELSFRCGNNWSSYNSSSALRLKGDRAYFALGPETTYDVYSDGAGRIGYYGSRREWKNVIGEVDKTAAYSRIMALSPVEYTWKPEHRPDTDNTELIGFNVHRGFIAEDVEAVDHVLAQYGWLYHEGDGDGDKTGQPLTEELGRTDQTLDDAVVVSYDSKAMFADLVAAVQYLAGRVEELEGAM